MRARGFTLIDLLITISIILVLGGISASVFARAKARAVGTLCLSNIRQIGTAQLLYSDANDGQFAIGGFPDAPSYWLTKLSLERPFPPGPVRRTPLIKCPTFECPSPDGCTSSGYSANGCAEKSSDVAEPASTVLSAEMGCTTFPAQQGYTCTQPMSAPDYPEFSHFTNYGRPGALRHFDRGNYGFVDGHAMALAATQFDIERGRNPCVATHRADAGKPHFYRN